MRHFILITLLLVFTSGYCLAQYDEIRAAQVQSKIQLLKEGTLKDSVLYSVLGFCVKNNYRFTKVSDYQIIVNTIGNYFKFDLSDARDAIVVSFVYFIPHNRQSALRQNDPNFEWVPNEHLCICAATQGVAIATMSDKGFTCVGAKPEWDVPENININCHDTEQRDIFFTKYHAIGRGLQDSLQIVAPQFIE